MILKDPFRLFFPLGALFAVAGIAPWVISAYTGTSYPRDLHRLLMINGFMLSFVCGFLMTAVPRFTGSHFANKGDIASVFLFLLLVGVGAFSPTPFAQALAFGAAALTLLSLVHFLIQRFLKKTSNPPPTFLFIGTGLGLWIMANTVSALKAAGVVLPTELSLIAEDLFSNGVVLFLILGVGGRLIPGILGWQEIVTHQRSDSGQQQISYLKVIPPAVWIALFLFLGSYLLQTYFSTQIIFSLRAAVTLYFALASWKIHRLPPNRSYLTWGIWISCWCLVIGTFLPVAWPASGVHGFHFLYIAGFSLLTFLISLRVTFAHGPLGTEVEKTSPSILVFCGLMLLATLTRVTAFIWPHIYLHHLGYAALTWLIALALWVFIKKPPCHRHEL